MTRLPGPPDVIVVGAGPTGVTVAILLGQYGVRTLVLDRWPEVYPQPRAVHLDDEVFRILARLGVAEEVARITRPGAGLQLMSPDHQVLARFNRTGPPTSNGFPPANMFDQPDLEAVLRARMLQVPAVEFRGGLEVTGLGTLDGRSSVQVRDPATGVTEEISATYVLGCDGANSVVRTSAGSQMKELGFAQRWLVLDIATDRELGHWEGVHQVCDSTRAATYMRIGETRHRWEFQLLAGEVLNDFETLDDVAPLLRPWVADTTGLEVVRLAEYTFRAQIADRWRVGDVLLLGDAAHLTPPFIGQGMGSGIRDAGNLAWKLAAVLRGELPADVLDTYEAERRPHALALIKVAVAMGRAMTGGGRSGDLARRVLVPLASGLPGIGTQITEGRSPALHSSALNVRRPRGLAGSLAPNALANGSQLDALDDGRLALITTDPTSSVAGVRVVRADRGNGLDAWLRRGRCRAALVRPDGTVAATGRAVDRVLALLSPSLQRTR